MRVYLCTLVGLIDVGALMPWGTIPYRPVDGTRLRTNDELPMAAPHTLCLNQAEMHVDFFHDLVRLDPD